MSKARNHHYVPQWHQEGFFEPGRNTLAYLDLTPPREILADERVITPKALFDAPTSRAFRQTDLYSTFFGTSVNDEIERRLFGDIDTRGSKAVKAFAAAGIGEWHRHFQALFEYIDVQKLRTPKGLDWLKAQYPALGQNELMFEMQGIRMMHCTIWTEGVREIVSAEHSDVKFIVSDHPVTIYNHAAPPSAPACAYPQDPTIALKASQTIFPLNRDFCLILTNLEYAEDPATRPLEKRTFARHYRTSMVRTDSFIRTRKLNRREVARINYVLKARARRYIAAGRKEWLYPEELVSGPWNELRTTLLPPKKELWHFGGELITRFEDGHVHYQDAFGRTEKERDFLKKESLTRPIRLRDACGCGSGHSYRACCKSKPVALRPTWNEYSIRERNLMLYNGIVNVLGLTPDKDWLTVRRELTDEKIGEVYLLYEALWPLETDLLQLLPKPDGSARAVYTGYIHPASITDFALGASLYFGELLIQHPFLHAGTVKKEFSPVANPRAYRQEILKTLLFFFTVMPLVESGRVNLIPDPCNFDTHLRDQMLHMARSRVATEAELRKDARMAEFMKEDYKRGMLLLPPDALRAQIAEASPELNDAQLDEAMQVVDRLKERDPLAVLQEDSLDQGGQYSHMKLAPNFEMAMYLAQATGSCIVTNNFFRWRELTHTTLRRTRPSHLPLAALAENIGKSLFAFPQNVADIEALAADKNIAPCPQLMRDVFKYLSRVGDRGAKPNVEQNLAARFTRAHASAQAAIRKARIPVKEARLSSAFLPGGIQDNTVNRLLLMSSSEAHLPAVPMAFLIGAD